MKITVKYNPQTPKIEIERGDYYVKQGSLYIVAQTSLEKYTLIKLNTGNRFIDPTSKLTLAATIEGENMKKIGYTEMTAIFGD
ncbi:MAG: hypothetical protein KJP21_05580 [Bacteroidia bacterium]|nr:hypothetical protein [Bacteroidia bacterium]